MFLLKVYFKKVTEISSKTAKKVSTVPKTETFLKSIVVTDNGTKKVPRYKSTTVLPTYGSK